MEVKDSGEQILRVRGPDRRISGSVVAGSPECCHTDPTPHSDDMVRDKWNRQTTVLDFVPQERCTTPQSCWEGVFGWGQVKLEDRVKFKLASQSVGVIT